MPGDPVCAVGLYTSHYGRLSNSPVVRTGHVAAVAGEPVQSGRGYASAHLIELRTIAGLSGSPVFQTTFPVRIHNGQLYQRNEDESHGTILGMLIGYHVVETSEDQIQVAPSNNEADNAQHPLSIDERNTGFGVVIPIERVCDILESEGVQLALANALKLRRQLSAASD